jgi:L-lactate dehydrogenase complex protein LldG
MDVDANSRAQILRRIVASNGGSSTEQAARSSWEEIARNYKREGVLPRDEVVELFEERLRDYDATVTRVGREDVPIAVAKLLEDRHKQRLVLPSGLPAHWLPNGFTFVVDEEFSPNQLDAFDGVLTGATLAIAETGTVVLQGVPGQGRRALSLVPDYHLCLVQVEDVVETVPEAFRRLQGTARLPTTFVSGPSATADIEMTRIKGVHGPRVLDVLLID